MSSIDREQRRRFLRQALALGAAGGLGGYGLAALAAPAMIKLPFANGERELVAYPQKRPLIRLTARPPQLETPFAVFNEGLLTPNDAFFVRYHLGGVPTAIDPDRYRLRVRGHVARPLELSLAELKQEFGAAVELVAVTQCSGNSRGFFEPRVAGGQLANGAMGNARWRGVPLSRVLARAGVRAGARQVTFEGLDRPVLPGTPEFVKALDVAHALDGEVMLAYAMNGADLPMLNGYPVRLVVPGHYGTYWVKHLADIVVLDTPFEGFWMKKAYRVPDNACLCTLPGQVPDRTRPIGRYTVRSFITSLADGDTLARGQAVALRGIAFDGGHGIREVRLSVDGGKHWLGTALGEDLGVYSFREWRAAFTPTRAGVHALKVRAVSRAGEIQPLMASWNGAGYLRNVVETVRVVVS